MKKKKMRLFAIILLMVMTFTSIIFAFMNNEEEKIVEKEPEEEIIEEEVIIPKLQIIDEESNERPIAIMINNHPVTVPHHAGLQDAYVIYEIIVEGGFTRLMAVYKDQETNRIGSVRSARHYYLDYAAEHDAIYAHFGGSPKGLSDVRVLGIDALNFMARGGSFRDRSLGVATEHTAYTRLNDIKSELSKMNTRMTSNGVPFEYSIDELDLSVFDSKVASEVKIKYSTRTNVDYVFENGVYNRSFNGKMHVDAISKEQYNFKNLLIMKVRNYNLDSAGRQELDTVGTGNGYFVTNGISIPITWNKSSRTSPTVYKYINGEEVVLNDGNTFVNVVPTNAGITFN